MTRQVNETPEQDALVSPQHEKKNTIQAPLQTH